MSTSKSSRRNFIRKVTGTALAGTIGPSLLGGAIGPNVKILESPFYEKKNYAPNDQVNVAVIGMGIMGFNNCHTTVKIPGVELVATCDLYDGRLER